MGQALYAENQSIKWQSGGQVVLSRNTLGTNSQNVVVPVNSFIEINLIRADASARITSAGSITSSATISVGAFNVGASASDSTDDGSAVVGSLANYTFKIAGGQTVAFSVTTESSSALNSASIVASYNIFSNTP